MHDRDVGTPEAGYVRFPVDLDAAPLEEQIPPQYRGLVGFPCEEVAIYNPWMDVQYMEAVDPTYYGFAIQSTGGGFTAWILEQDGIEYMLTDHEGIARETPAGGWVLQAHPKDDRTNGNPLWALHIGVEDRGYIDLPEGHGLYLMDCDGDDETFAKASDVASVLHDAITNEIINGSLGRFYMPDGSDMLFEVTVRVKNPVLSPEVEGGAPWECPSCGQVEEFVGIDENGWLTQHVQIPEDGDDVKYGLYEPGEIGPYTEVRCARPLCNALVWEEYLS